MHVLRDAASIRGAVTQFPAVAPFIERRLDELAEYSDYELHELLNIVVVEVTDSLRELDDVLGFAAEDRTADAIDIHPGWYELTYVLGDDGFGLVLYVPDTVGIDPRLLELCSTPVTGRAQR
ncbi:hypothetical protein [Ramlibacter alkalitolerans]|uniref:Uncharacterized protein n=1 Tax=Ramlibacter alkalitolerans TaxID=2039631 RepID=A0ABS1JYE8_9BURK|nr:hypothetical protein [Ramlibacter alkalitolerans]MBL0428746.1 hypothetical protein [Ramlibacter alkalitolerans]